MPNMTATKPNRAESTDLDLAMRNLARAMKRHANGGDSPADRTDRIERAWRYYKTQSTARRMMRNETNGKSE